MKPRLSLEQNVQILDDLGILKKIFSNFRIRKKKMNSLKGPLQNVGEVSVSIVFPTTMFNVRVDLGVTTGDERWAS